MAQMKNFIVLLIVLLFITVFVSCGHRRKHGGAGNPQSPDEQIVAVIPSLPPSLQSAGGNGSTGTGGNGPSVFIAATGKINIMKNGTVDAGFILPTTRNFGENHVVLSAETHEVQLNTDSIPGGLYMKTGSGLLYLGNGNNVLDETSITGLTVPADAVLVLNGNGARSFHHEDWTNYGALDLVNDVLIEGKIISSPSLSKGIAITANRIEIAEGGIISASSVTADVPAREIHLTAQTGRKIVNRGLIEARGMGTGNGGNIFLNADELASNTGIIDTSGGDTDTGAGGNGGNLEVNVYYGNFYSSGTVLLNGGAGTLNGGNGGRASIVTRGIPDYSITNVEFPTHGDIIISGTWEANGGNCSSGNGGNRGSLVFVTNAMGSIVANAELSAKGGNGTGSQTASGGGGADHAIVFQSLNKYPGDASVPGKIRLTGAFDVRGGDGELNGGNAGQVRIEAFAGNKDYTGTDVEVILPDVVLNGGNGASKGGDSGRIEAYTLVPQDGSANSVQSYANTNAVPAGPIVNEAAIQAKGGSATSTSGVGGAGGVVVFQTDDISLYNGPSFSSVSTTITNSGNMDCTGGNGERGGDAKSVTMTAATVSNTGDIVCNGGAGTITGGNGGAVTVTSTQGTSAYTGIVQTSGGTGSSPGNNGTQTVDGVVVP